MLKANEQTDLAEARSGARSVCTLLLSATLGLSLWATSCGAPRVLDRPALEGSQPVAPIITRPETPIRQATLEEVGLDSSIMDRSVDPCDDFYQFACGSWVKKASLPDDEAVWVRSYSGMAQTIETNLRSMLESFANPPEGTHLEPNEAILGDFYASCMDEKTMDSLGTKPIGDLLNRIEHVRSRSELGHLILDLQVTGVSAFLRTDGVADGLDTSKVAGDTWKTGWVLSNEEYVRHDPHNLAIREQYEKTLAAMLDASPTPKALRARRIHNAMEIEALLSERTAIEDSGNSSWKDAKRWSASDLDRDAPGFPWKEYLESVRPLPGLTFNVTDPAGVEQVARIIQTEPLDALRDYLYVRTLFTLAYALDRPLRTASFALQTARWGLKKDKARWRTCVRTTQYTLGDALVPAYAVRYHFDKTDPIVLQMVHEIYDAWEERLGEAPWLDDSTREAAIAKLHNMKYHVGYRDEPSSEPIALDRKAFLTNMLRLDRARHTRVLATIGGPSDRDVWNRSPLEVNAYNDQERNSIFIHLAMLLPPVYSPQASVPVQFGALGMAIGHEVAHGFDQRGSKFDPNGVERNWWSEPTKKEFEQRKQCFVDQFSSFKIYPDLNVNGKLSVSENMADVAGLRMAFRAYRKHQEHATARSVADGFSEDQQFFLARAQGWCSVFNEEGVRRSNATNAHIYPKWAIDGPLHDLPEFHAAFGCKVPRDICTVW